MKTWTPEYYTTTPDPGPLVPASPVVPKTPAGNYKSVPVFDGVGLFLLIGILCVMALIFLDRKEK